MLILPTMSFFRVSRRNPSTKSAHPLRRSLGFTVLFVSTFLLGTEVVFPFLNTRMQVGATSPVPEDFISEMALKRIETFSFDELAKFRAHQLESTSSERDLLELEEGETVPRVFYLSVPKLKLKDIPVETNSVDTTPFEKLGHYKGSSLPGKRGNTFIYGHSTLPSYFDANNYKTLFTFLPNLKSGDEILIKYNDKELKYIVEKKEVFDPDEMNPLKYRHLHYSSISLMTCVPPGTTDQRMVVFAKQVY